MKIAGLQKLTLLDFPEQTAATLFTAGCNFQCPFCHNAKLVTNRNIDESTLIDEQELLSEQAILDFLKTRQGLLDGVCISGGEPLLHADIASLCAKIKTLGFNIKLDTNGSFPDRLRDLVNSNLIDYVALDVKNSPTHYAQTIGLDSYNVGAISKSINYLLGKPCNYEIRTTVVREYHDAAGLIELASWIEGANTWYLQNFRDSDGVLIGEGRLHSFSEPELENILPSLRKIVKNTQIRNS